MTVHSFLDPCDAWCHPWTRFALHVTMWAGMMTAMMAPVMWPWVMTFRRLLVPHASTAERWHTTLSFAGGYSTVWLAYAAAAAALQSALSSASLLDVHGRLPGIPGAAILVAAGLFQFTPFKRACLTHCRNPLTFLLTRWRDGAQSGFRIGVGHAAYCVGCCWALMATMLAVGLANLWWMAALTAAVFIEQAVPGGSRLRVPIAVVLIALGLREIS